MLQNTDWKLLEMIDNSKNYIKWYTKLLSKLKSNEKQVIQKFGENAYQKALNRYTDIYNHLINRQIGGGIFYINHARST
jgi:hypothetical protein